MTDMQEHIKRLAVEADPEFGNPDGDMPDAIVGVDAITRFAQSVARECAGIVDAADTPDGWSNSHIADAIRARFGLEG